MKYIIAILLLLIPVSAHAMDKKLGATNKFEIGIFDTADNGLAPSTPLAISTTVNIKVRCANQSETTLTSGNTTFTSRGGGYYYVSTTDAIAHSAEEECSVWAEGAGSYAGLIAKTPMKFKAVGATIDAVGLKDDAITAAKIAAGAIGASETGEYVFTVVSSGDCTNSAVLFDTNFTQTEPDHWRDAFATFTTGTLTGQTKAITAFNGTTKCMTVKSPGFSATPQAGDGGVIINK